jgi:hypothetical protein
MFNPLLSRPCLIQHFPSIFNPVLSQILDKCSSFPRISSATFNPVLSQPYVTQHFLAMIVGLEHVLIHCTHPLYSFTVLIHCTRYTVHSFTVSFTVLIHCTHSDVVTSAFKQPNMAAMCNIQAAWAEADNTCSGCAPTDRRCYPVHPR